MSAQSADVRMARLEGAYEQIDKRLGDLAATIDSRFAQVDMRLLHLEQKTDGQQWRLTSLILATWVTTMLTLLLKH